MTMLKQLKTNQDLLNINIIINAAAAAVNEFTKAIIINTRLISTALS
jgi:hypothetical protein